MLPKMEYGNPCSSQNCSKIQQEQNGHEKFQLIFFTSFLLLYLHHPTCQRRHYVYTYPHADTFCIHSFVQTGSSTTEVTSTRGVGKISDFWQMTCKMSKTIYRASMNKQLSCHWQTRATRCITTNGKILKQLHDHNHALLLVICHPVVRIDIAYSCTKLDDFRFSRSSDMIGAPKIL